MQFGCISPSRSRYRDVQKLLLYRGIDVSHEAIRAWCQKFGQQYANEIRRRRPRVGDKWHLDEMVVTPLWQRCLRAINRISDIYPPKTRQDISTLLSAGLGTGEGMVGSTRACFKTIAKEG